MQTDYNYSVRAVIDRRSGLWLLLIVELKYYKPPHGFEDAITFTDSIALFEDLWEEWLNTKLYLMAKGTPLMEKGYKGVFESLSEEKQSELIVRKANFAKVAGIYL